MADRIDFGPLLAQLDAEVLIEELRRRLGLAAANDGGQSQPTTSAASPNARDAFTTGLIRPDEFFRLSNPEAIRKYLAIMKRPQSPRAIVEGLRAGGVLTNAKNFYANIWTELKRARERGEVVNTPSGWGLAEWYPNKPKQSEAPKVRRRRSRKRAKGAGAKDDTHSPKEGKQRLVATRTGQEMTWRPFLKQAMKAGKTMQQASAEWKAKKSGSSGG